MSSVPAANGNSNPQIAQNDQRESSSSALSLRTTALACSAIFGTLAVLFTASTIVTIFFAPVVVPIVLGSLAATTAVVALAILAATSGATCYSNRTVYVNDPGVTVVHRGPRFFPSYRRPKVIRPAPVIINQPTPVIIGKKRPYSPVVVKTPTKRVKINSQPIIHPIPSRNKVTKKTTVTKGPLGKQKQTTTTVKNGKMKKTTTTTKSSSRFAPNTRVKVGGKRG